MTASGPHTRQSLAGDLAALGLRAGDTILLHSSLRAVGWVCGGPAIVVRALLDVLGPDGTLVVPAQTPDNRDPSRWHHQPVPEQWWPIIREHLPPFDPATSHCRAMGLIAETVRTWPGAVRSAHPQTSFAAVGARAAELMAVHQLESELGEESPLAALEAADARALLLGVGYDRCTAFHLAEYRLPWIRHRSHACVMTTPAGRRWVSFQATALDAGDFPELGSDFERRTGSVPMGRVGGAVARLLSIREAVTFARGWMVQHRQPVVSEGVTCDQAKDPSSSPG
jgi:aminoglycoside 3-N-acetyltransferase